MDNNDKTDILTAINTFAASVDERFNNVDKRFDAADKRFDKIEGDIKEIRGDIQEIRGDVQNIRGTMVTKDYLDEKMADQRGDLVVLMRKEDNKVKRLIDVLIQRGVITTEDKKSIVEMEPFPELRG
ncbi:TPA: hypothetical protein DF272_03000 [Candidatus Falkowbacteria bacterium]|nr:hypothetical protein [Candidatus Falkowbacteria bacterium]